MALRHERLFIICMAAAAALAGRPAGAQVINLAQGAHYAANCRTLPGWDGLVDGIKDSDDPPGCWASDNSANFPKQVVIDLGGLCEVSRVVIHNSTNGNTKQIQVAVSEDGSKYDLLREYVFPPNKYQPLVHTFTPRKARFVRITFLNTWGGGIGGDNIIYLREVEVFGRRLEKKPEGLEALWRELAARLSRCSARMAGSAGRSRGWLRLHRAMGSGWARMQSFGCSNLTTPQPSLMSG